MKRGYLSEYFQSVGMKRLTAVEANVLKSHQHEFNVVEGFRAMLGEPEEAVRFDAKFLYLTDDDDEPVSDDGFLTWYDARRKARVERSVMRWEYRLYFPTNVVSQCAAEGDLLVIARLTDDSLLAIVAEAGSTIERQIAWLFGFSEVAHPGFSVKSELETEQDRIGFAARVVLEQIGVEIEEEAPNFLDQMLVRFGGRFPSTSVFSAYARASLPDVSSHDDPDGALLVWMEREEVLFRTLEKHLLGDQLRTLTAQGDTDPDQFIRLVQSALQRRKSRAGSALENHLEQVFTEHGITYSRTSITENRLKPDFIFPSIRHYADAAFPSDRLTMLAAKSTCKDRWRQIINEAARIPSKHLLTLEPSISLNQTNEMKNERVQLVIPASLHGTYTESQRSWLLRLSDFIELASSRQ